MVIGEDDALRRLLGGSTDELPEVQELRLLPCGRIMMLQRGSYSLASPRAPVELVANDKAYTHDILFVVNTQTENPFLE